VSRRLPAPVTRSLTVLGAAALVLSTWGAAAGAAPSYTAADTWIIKAIGTEQHVGSVHIKGSITQGTTTINVSLVVNGDGEGGGTFVESGSVIQLKRVGPLLYFNAPRKFWHAHATAARARAYGGKWIEVSALDKRFQSFDQFLNAGDLVAAVFAGHPTPLTVSGPTRYQRHTVVILGDTFTQKGKRSTGSMYLSATGPAIVYKIVERSPTESGTITFSHYGPAVSITTPPEPINLS